MDTDSLNADAQIRTLVHRLFRALDERAFSPGWMRAHVTPDARMETPLGNSEGDEAVRQTERALGRYERTQHIASGILTDVGTGTATASWNALMTHVHREDTLRALGPDTEPLFVVGGHYEADLCLTPGGWRFRRIAVRPVWTKGRPPLLPPTDGSRAPHRSPQP
ncbi:nuclear transport factor 2 family protein [Streptomyces sp. NPDC058964]|uniref:nuclear transport factor 2 family protein n=1 Tax=Streptomyces sp. NPDC058964 TaxID=3346681 RepID=UPI00369F4B47